jgi:hypothetical protein
MGKGGDDIYHWSATKPILFLNKEKLQDLNFLVIDKLLADPLSHTKSSVYIIKDKSSLIALRKAKLESLNAIDLAAFEALKVYFIKEFTFLSPDGAHGYKLPSNSDIVIKIEAPFHEGSYFILTSDQWTKLDNLTLPLSPKEKTIASDPDLQGNQVLRETVRGIKTVQNGLILGKSADVLEKMVTQLGTNKTFNLYITVHTSAVFNSRESLKISSQLASALKKWFVFKGVEEKRISILPKGSKEILNHCKEGIRCSEEEHSLNERVEFLITKPND